MPVPCRSHAGSLRLATRFSAIGAIAWCKAALGTSQNPIKPTKGASVDSVSCARLALVYPRLAEKIMQLGDRLEAEGITIRVVQGLRTWAEQDNLYAQGRTQPGKIVTNAPGGSSYHNFGLAVDCAPFLEDGSGIDWNAEHSSWKRMEAIGTSLGLTSGANWTRLIDAPHFQLTGRFPEAGPNDELRTIWRDGGNPAVWAIVDGDDQLTVTA